jgi:hypothetical protein
MSGKGFYYGTRCPDCGIVTHRGTWCPACKLSWGSRFRGSLDLRYKYGFRMIHDDIGQDFDSDLERVRELDDVV